MDSPNLIVCRWGVEFKIHKIHELWIIRKFYASYTSKYARALQREKNIKWP
jgi:hypothetical protein